MSSERLELYSVPAIKKRDSESFQRWGTGCKIVYISNGQVLDSWSQCPPLPYPEKKEERFKEIPFSE